MAILGQIASASGGDESGQELLAAGLSRARELGNQLGTAIQLNFLGQIAQRHGDYDRAAGDFGEALETSRRVGDRLLILLSLYNLALIRLELGDVAGAADLIHEGLGLATEAGDDSSTAHLLEALAAVQRDPSRAGRLYGAAETLLQQYPLRAPKHSTHPLGAPARRH